MADIRSINGKNIKDAMARNEISNLKNSSHSHTNKAILDTITQEKINFWDGRENVGTSNITIGTVTTLEPGEEATVEIVQSGSDYILNFGLPKGDKGETGGSGTNFSVLYDEVNEKLTITSVIENNIVYNENTESLTIGGSN